MKITRALILGLMAFYITGCGNDDAPILINEDEVITTITATFTPENGGTPIVLTSRDLDGDGPTPPVVTVSGEFIAATTYNGQVTFLNELATPAEDITEEVEEEGAEHQVFFQQAGLGIITYTDQDSNGNPIGLTVTYQTTDVAASGNMIITLRHEPNKSAAGVAGGDITNAGGSTDAEVSFPVSVVLP